MANVVTKNVLNAKVSTDDKVQKTTSVDTKKHSAVETAPQLIATDETVSETKTDNHQITNDATPVLLKSQDFGTVVVSQANHEKEFPFGICNSLIPQTFSSLFDISLISNIPLRIAFEQTTLLPEQEAHHFIFNNTSNLLFNGYIQKAALDKQTIPSSTPFVAQYLTKSAENSDYPFSGKVGRLHFEKNDTLQNTVAPQYVFEADNPKSPFSGQINKTSALPADALDDIINPQYIFAADNKNSPFDGQVSKISISNTDDSQNTTNPQYVFAADISNYALRGTVQKAATLYVK